jgi:hypothetical protein
VGMGLTCFVLFYFIFCDDDFFPRARALACNSFYDVCACSWKYNMAELTKLFRLASEAKKRRLRKKEEKLSNEKTGRLLHSLCYATVCTSIITRATGRAARLART